MISSSIKFLLGLLLSFLVTPSYAAQTCQDVFVRKITPAKIRTYEASKNVSQYIRDNAPDYWRWSKSNGRDYFGKLMDFEGIVIGDAHPGNFIYSPLSGRMKFFIMDIKDAGNGPYISDIAHQIMATNAVFNRREKEDIDRSTERQMEAYLAGLRNEKFETHERIDWIFETRKREFDEEVQEYVESKTVGSKFKFKEDKLERLSDHVKGKEKLAQLKSEMTNVISKTIKGAKVLDFAFRPRERGGSKDLIRYWALVKNGKKNIILEFKEIDDPAVAQYTKQLPAIERFNLVMKTFWNTKDDLYQAVNLDGTPFWMRPKKVDVFSVPYKQNDKEERKFLRHLAAYEAYLMGRYHGKQTKTKEYAKLISSRFDKIVEEINEMSDDYVDRLVERVEELQENEIFN